MSEQPVAHVTIHQDGSVIQNVAVSSTFDSGLVMSLDNVQGRETKAEVLARAEQRLSQHIARYGIDESTFKMLHFYEARYAIAPGEDVGLMQEQRCLNREGLSHACLLPVDHKGLCDWEV